MPDSRLQAVHRRPDVRLRCPECRRPSVRDPLRTGVRQLRRYFAISHVFFSPIPPHTRPCDILYSVIKLPMLTGGMAGPIHVFRYESFRPLQIPWFMSVRRGTTKPPLQYVINAAGTCTKDQTRMGGEMGRAEGEGGEGGGGRAEGTWAGGDIRRGTVDSGPISSFYLFNFGAQTSS